MSGILILILVGVLVAVAVRRTSTHEGTEASDGLAVRRLFQYALLYGLLVVVCAGLSGLLGRLLDRGVLLAADETALARDLAFTVVGVPVLVGVAIWTRRRFSAAAGEARSLGWNIYVTAASLTSLIAAMTGLGDVLEWATGLADRGGSGSATLLVWGASWGVHWWLDGRVTPRAHSRFHHVAGSLIGLVTSAVGLVGVLAGALRAALTLDGGAVLVAAGNPTVQGLVTAMVGAPVWIVYWVGTTARRERDAAWLAYVLLAGVAGGLVTAVASASTLLYDVLVWLVGDPGTAGAREHFQDAPSAAAAALVGLSVWWYHQAVLGRAAGPRTEVRRIYEYLMAGIGLLAAAAGLGTAVVALVEAVTGPERTVVGTGSTVDTLLAAGTLLVVGGPVWWVYWRRIEAAAAAAPVEERGSPVRRVYLLLLFGLGGVAAVIALLTGMFLFFEDAVDGALGTETLRRVRFAIGVLLTTAAVAAYHGAVYRADRAHRPGAVASRGPDFVLLVGPGEPDLARGVARQTHGRVQAWARTDDGLPQLTVDGVMNALADSTDAEVIVLSDAGGIRVIPVRRG